MNKTLRVVASNDDLSEVAIYAFLDLMMGDFELATMQVSQTRAHLLIVQHRSFTPILPSAHFVLLSLVSLSPASDGRSRLLFAHAGHTQDSTAASAADAAKLPFRTRTHHA